MTYETVLSRAFQRAQDYLSGGLTPQDIVQASPTLQKQTLRQSLETNQPIASISTALAVDTLISNLNQNKYLFSILGTALATKVILPGVDIRNHQSDMENSYSNRSTDQVSVTPFLKKVGLTHCAASGMESGRNFERPFPFNLSFPTKPRGAGNREAFLGLLHAVQEDGADPEDLLAYLFYKDLSTKKTIDYQRRVLADVTEKS